MSTASRGPGGSPVLVGFAVGYQQRLGSAAHAACEKARANRRQPMCCDGGVADHYRTAPDSRHYRARARSSAPPPMVDRIGPRCFHPMRRRGPCSCLDLPSEVPLRTPARNAALRRGPIRPRDRRLRDRGRHARHRAWPGGYAAPQSAATVGCGCTARAPRARRGSA